VSSFFLVQLVGKLRHDLNPYFGFTVDADSTGMVGKGGGMYGIIYLFFAT
jgi:hypothetical protein